MERQWVAVLDTGRFGDWVVVSAETKEQAERQLTRSQRRKLQSIKPTFDPEFDPIVKPGLRRR